MGRPSPRNDNPGDAMNMKIQIGIKVKAARQEKGLTQEQLAEAIGKAVETVSNIERGFALTGIETLQQISRVVGKPMTFFFEDVEDERKVSRKRLELEQEASRICNAMSDADLQLAVHLLRTAKDFRNHRS